MKQVIIMLCASLLFGQSDLVREREIKSSGQYRWGEGIDADPAKAEDAAMRDLPHKIYVALATSTGRKVVETQAAIADTTQVETSTYSALQLTGLDKLRFTEGDKTRVIAFIDTADLSRSFDLARRKVRNLTAQALTAESERRIDDALRLAYWAYLTTFTYVGGVRLNLGVGSNTDARAALAEKMIRLVEGLSVQANPCYREAGAPVSLIQFDYYEQPVQNLDVRYYCGEGTDWASVRDGRS